MVRVALVVHIKNMLRFEKIELDGRGAHESVDGAVGDSGGKGVLGEGGQRFGT